MVGRKRDVGLGPAFGEDPINLADWRRADCCDRKGESFRWGGQSVEKRRPVEGNGVERLQGDSWNVNSTLSILFHPYVERLTP